MLLRRRRWQEGDGRRWHPEQPRVVVQAGVDVRQGGGDADVQLVLVAVEVVRMAWLCLPWYVLITTVASGMTFPPASPGTSTLNTGSSTYMHPFPAGSCKRIGSHFLLDVISFLNITSERVRCNFQVKSYFTILLNVISTCQLLS